VRTAISRSRVQVDFRAVESVSEHGAPARRRVVHRARRPARAAGAVMPASSAVATAVLAGRAAAVRVVSGAGAPGPAAHHDVDDGERRRHGDPEPPVGRREPRRPGRASPGRTTATPAARRQRARGGVPAVFDDGVPVFERRLSNAGATTAPGGT
jgi:hypothetical protein